MQISYLFLTVILCLLLSSHTAQQTGGVMRIGNDLKLSNKGSQWQDTTFLLYNRATQAGTVFAFSAVFRNLNPVTLQFWRPAGSGAEFTLVGQVNIQPTEVSKREDFYVGKECIRLRQGDQLGFVSPVIPGSLVYEFDPSKPKVFTNSQNGSAVKVNDALKFEGLSLPYVFSVVAWVDTASTTSSTDCPTGVYIPTTTTTIPTTTTPVPITGAQGPPGPAGPQGEVGQMGPRGDTGPQGPQGEVGSTGPMGPQGAKGETGEQGSAGAPGPVGPTGPQGETGQKGAKGDKGDDGEKGDKGETGARGPAGLAGPPGPQGPSAAGSKSGVTSGCSWCDKLMNAYVMIAVLIWLFVITILVIATLCVATYRRRQEKKVLRYNANVQNSWAGSRSDLWNDGPMTEKPKNGHSNPGMEHTYYQIEEGITPC